MKLNQLADRAGARKNRTRIGRTAQVPDTPATRGMIAKVRHLVRVVDAKGERQ